VKLISIFLLSFFFFSSLTGVCSCCIEVRKAMQDKVKQIKEEMEKNPEWQAEHYILEAELRSAKLAIELTYQKCTPSKNKKIKRHIKSLSSSS